MTVLYAKLVLPPNKEMTAVKDVGFVTEDSSVRPLSVHECGFRIGCVAYVLPLRALAKKMVSSEQQGFLGSTMGNIYKADQEIHAVGSGSKRGGGFSRGTRSFTTCDG